MSRLFLKWLIVASFLSSGAAANDFTYHPPGELLPGTGEGRKDDRALYFPQFAFPLSVGASSGAHAYAGSQINGVKGGSNNAMENYVYPWRDVYCENRAWDMPLCPSGKGHQGVDIRPSTNANDVWQAVAMDDGTVTSVTSNTTVTIRAADGYYCRYLHLAKKSISDAGIKANVSVKKGVTPIGRVSNIMGGIPNTSIHLHFDCKKRVGNEIRYAPVYTSLVSAYRRSWGLPSVDVDGNLGVDPVREVGGEAPGEACGPLGEPIDTAAGYAFSSFWMHNCSLMGLVTSGEERKIVYVRPKPSIRTLVQADPVLFVGRYADGRYSGSAKVYSSVCGPMTFEASGPVSGDFRRITVAGHQPIRNEGCVVTGTKLTELPFVYQGTLPPNDAAAAPDEAAAPPDEAQPPPSEATATANIIGDLLFRNVLDRAFPSIASKWPMANPRIAVCWENEFAASEADRQLIRAAAEETWEAASKIDFEGWQACVANNRGIRIQIDDSGPHVKGLGALVDGVRNGMVLNTKFQAWGTSCAKSEGERRECLYSIAVHEFGHAIGFAHEHNRHDRPGECTKRPQGSDGDTTTLTPYDPYSVMNYCNSVYNNNGRLSEWDRYAVAQIYGAK